MLDTTKQPRQPADIAIRAVPPKNLNEAERLKLAHAMAELLRGRGFHCELVIPEIEY